ncbi:RNA recognition motif domain-containing protein [Mucilaginibacter sp. E4BP6]|uniref:RNA recognition motif domain-containing protein n=1 Tax=Mucilaginibacter sp. E4BP6 TaxID=2723089 RepID=UPI0015CDB9C5|nr:RNA-binding protein [Mucilaginibacter sp. E4BP6]NYE67208.1 RNA recognition motif-containing protein [Mucilaginibacter sp. E4BP6]
MVKLFISGFPLNSTELEIVQLVGPYANVSTIKIVRDKVSKKCKGYAFLEVTDQKEAEAAIDALSGTPLGDRELTLNIVEEKPVKLPAPKRSFGSKPAYNSGSSNYDPQKKKRPRRII